MNAINSLARGARKEVDILKRFATSDRLGPFEAADEMIKTARSTVKDAGRSAGFYGMRGGMMKIKPLARIKGIKGYNYQSGRFRAQIRKTLPKGLKILKNRMR